MAVLDTGTLVELVSGSPRMAVEKVEGKIVHCVWFNNGTSHRDSFEIPLLRKCEPRGAGGGEDRKSGGDRKFGDKKPFDRDRGGRGGKPFNKR